MDLGLSRLKRRGLLKGLIATPLLPAAINKATTEHRPASLLAKMQRKAPKNIDEQRVDWLRRWVYEYPQLEANGQQVDTDLAVLRSVSPAIRQLMQRQRDAYRSDLFKRLTGLEY